LNEERKVRTINPATEEVLREYQIISKEQIDDKIKKAQNAFQGWKKDASKRTDLLHDFANELRKDKENLAKTATNDGDLYEMLEDQFRSENKEDKDKFEKLRARYKKVSEEHGAEIKGVYYITRSEPFASLYENADFSIDTIKASIKDGEIKTNQILKNIK
jgi:acyl-CoA reductase-like NAD-dependent aldehyde dehydrogenase